MTEHSSRPYGGRLPEERRQDRRERLLDAGLELFGTQGFAAASIERLCARAGVTTRHFYDEFVGREELLRAVYDRIVEDAWSAVSRTLESGGDEPYERIRVSLDAFLRSYLDDPRRGRVVALEVIGVSRDLERHRRAVVHRFAGIIAEESRRNARRRGLPVRDFRLAAIGLAGAATELVTEWLAGEGDRPSVADLRDELLGLFVAQLEGSAAAKAYVDRLRAGTR